MPQVSLAQSLVACVRRRPNSVAGQRVKQSDCCCTT